MLGAVGASAPLPAQQAPSFDQGWRWVDFPPEDLPTGTIAEMTESGGVPWIRTERAVAFYDDFQWIVVDSTLGFPPLLGEVTSLAADGRDGVLVVVGGVVLQGDSLGLRTLLHSAGLVLPLDSAEVPGWEVKRAFPNPGGGIFFTANRAGEPSGRAFILEGGDIRGARAPAGISGEGRHAWITRTGRIWASTSRGLVRWDGEGWVEAEGLARTYRVVTFLTENPDGSGFAFRDTPVRERSLLAWQRGGRPTPVPSEGKYRLLGGDVYEDGSALMIWESGHVRALEGGRWETVQLPTPRSQGLHFAHVTENRDLWLASGSGLHWYRGSSLDRWDRWFNPFPEPRNQVNALIPMPDGSVWAGSSAGVTHYHPPTGATRHRLPVGEEVAVTGLARDSSGGIWAVSGISFSGALRWDGQAWERWGPERGLEAGTVHAVQVDRRGGVWLLSNSYGEAGGTPGVYRVFDGRVTRWVDPDARLDDRAYAFAEGPDGSWWFGTANGLSRFREGTWSHWGPEEGVAGRVFHIAVDPEGEPWFTHGTGTTQGLGILRGDSLVEYMTQADGLPSDLLMAVAFDSAGTAWVTTPRGVAFHRNGFWNVLDEKVGFDSPSAWPIAWTETHLLLGTMGGGIAGLSRQEEGNPPPRIVALTPMVEGRRVRVSWQTFPYRGETAEERVFTRHRLDGGPWSTWSTDHSFTGSEMSPGPHTVTIQARGLFGQYAEEGETADFEVPPPLYRDPLFALPVGALLLLLAGSLVAWIIHKRERDEALREGQERLRTLVETAPEAIALYDPEADRFLDANENALRLFGILREQVTSVDPAVLSPLRQPDGRSSQELARELVEEALAGGAPVRQWVARGARGREIPCELRLVALPSAGKRLIRFSLVDISERVEAEARRQDLEARLFQSQKLEAVGQLTGGVAHDFNNLLTVVMGNLDLIRSDVPDDSPLLPSVDGALQATQRGALLTQRLLAFSRRQTLEPRTLRVEELVQGIMGLLRRTLGETVLIETVLPEGLWAILADPAQLESAILNLAINARDAMPRGGRLIIQAMNTTVDGFAGEEELAPGDYLVVAVTDTGSGMSRAVASRAFEPFFTTKEVGRGSGLGLSMVYGFARQSGGTARIYSEEGVGTTVRLYFPRSLEGMEGMDQGRAQESVHQGAGEHVLLVEDEPEVRRTALLILERLGYRTLEAEDGPRALAVLATTREVDLLLTDIVLPGGMNGVELAREARRLRPGLRVLFTSGYTEETVLREGRLEPDFDLLAKPFDRVTLSRKLREALGRP